MSSRTSRSMEALSKIEVVNGEKMIHVDLDTFRTITTLNTYLTPFFYEHHYHHVELKPQVQYKDNPQELVLEESMKFVVKISIVDRKKKSEVSSKSH